MHYYFKQPDTSLEGAKIFRVETFLLIIDSINVSLLAQRRHAYEQI